MQEIFLNDGLISREEWEAKIDSMKSQTGPELHSRDEIKALLKESIKRAVLARAPKRKFGILLSGGLDSALIALLLKELSPICYVFGFSGGKEPDDVKVAVAAGEELDLDVKVRLVDVDEARALVERTAKILGKEVSNPVSVSIAAVELACIEMAKEDGVDVLFGGLGAEEIFAGYNRHRGVDDVNKECWRGLRAMWSKDLVRDCTLADSQKVSLATPFLDEDLIKLSMRVPGLMKVDDQFTKVILREIAEELGLPRDIAWRPKKAAQYGSRMERALDKIAKGKQNDYIESLF